MAHSLDNHQQPSQTVGLRGERLRAFAALLLLVLTTTSVCAEEKYAPLPKKIVEAKTVYIDNQTGNPQVADVAYTELVSWGRFEITDDATKADLILRLRAVVTEGPDQLIVVPLSSGAVVGSGGTTKNYFINLSVLDASNGSELWTVTQPGAKNPKKSGTRKCVLELRKRFPKPTKESQ